MILRSPGDPYDYRDARFDPNEPDDCEPCRQCGARLAECDVIDWNDAEDRPICGPCFEANYDPEPDYDAPTAAERTAAAWAQSQALKS